MFRCERCGSSYSAMHAVALENCPRCQIRERTASPLTFKPFQFPDTGQSKQRSPEADLPSDVTSTTAAGDP